MAPNSQWPSVTVTIKPAVFRGHINPQPAAERLVAVPRTDCGRGYAPVYWIPIDATVGYWRVHAGSTSVVAPPARGRWQPGNG